MTVTAETLQWHLCLQFGLSLSLPQAAFVTLVILPARNLGALSTNLRHRTSNFITLVKIFNGNWPGFTGGTYEEQRLSGGIKSGIVWVIFGEPQRRASMGREEVDNERRR